MIVVHALFSVQDGGGKTSPIGLFFSADNGATLSIIEWTAEQIWNAIKPMITGVLVDVKLSYRKVDFSSWDNNEYSALSDVEEKAVTVLRTYNSYKVQISIPTVKETILTMAGAGHEINVFDADVVDFYQLVTDGFGDGSGFTDARGNAITIWVGSHEKFG